MIGDNIRKYRKEKGFSQEEMAVRLHVVRQTVSKWEKGLSVPDAEAVINMAALLDIPVNKLLGTDTGYDNIDNLTDELARLNDKLAKKNQHEAMIKKADKKRGAILLLSFLSMLISLGVDNPTVSIVLSGACILTAVTILYRNLALMTGITTNDMRLKVLRTTTIFNMCILVLCITLAALKSAGIVSLSENSEKLFAMFLIAGIMTFTGIVAPKLPFTRHTGLRLPWTVQDQDTWNIAHSILGIISLPLALLYIACCLTVDYFEQITFVAIILWVGIPGVISYIFFLKKMYCKL